VYDQARELQFYKCSSAFSLFSLKLEATQAFPGLYPKPSKSLTFPLVALISFEVRPMVIKSSFVLLLKNLMIESAL
jgi:hypothetical protein